MAYAVQADVEGLIAQWTLSATSKPTSTQVGVIITDVSNEIDSLLAGLGYTVPVTAPSYFLDWLGILNAYGAAAAVLKSMFPDAAGPGETPAYAFWESRYKAGLGRLKDGSAIPAGLARSSKSLVPSTYFTRNPDEDEDLGDIAEPRIKMDKVF